MLMNEFDVRFAAKDEKSLLFEILHRIGCLERKAVVAMAQEQGWLVWEPDPSSGGSGVGLARA